MSLRNRMWAFVLLLAGAAFVLLAGLSVHRYYYPHGFRAGKLTTFRNALEQYADDHGGWYPRGGATALGSLQKLYPKYETSGLAGLSGNEALTAARLRGGGTLDETLSSWVYFPGFRNDDNPKVAIIWEREAGIFINGGRADGHAVGFVSGGVAQVPSAAWPGFLAEQERLRTEVSGSRAASGTSKK